MIFVLSVVLLTITAQTCAQNPTAKIGLNDRQRIYQALLDQKLLYKERQLVRLVHVCNLNYNKKVYPVIEVKEHVRGAQVPRGILTVFILDSSLKYVNKIDYDISASPLYCKSNKLYWYGYVELGGYLPEGNVVTFTNGGKEMSVTNVDINEFPAQVPPQ